MRTFAIAIRKQNDCRHKIGIWCNGNTTDSGPVIPGSSPGIPTKRCSLRVASFLCNNYKVSCQESLCPDNIGTENFSGSHL